MNELLFILLSFPMAILGMWVFHWVIRGFFRILTLGKPTVLSDIGKKER